MILRCRLLKVVFLALLLTFLVPTIALPIQVEITDISDDKYFEVVHNELQKAEESIYVAMYEIFVYSHNKTSPPYILLKDLIDAHNRGVEVKVFLDRSYKYNPETKRWEKQGYFD